MGDYHGRDRIISIEDYRESEDIDMDSLFSMLYFGVGYPKNFFGFGYPKVKGGFKSYLSRHPVTQSWEIWTTYHWTHVCLAYRKEDGFLKMIKV